MRKTIIIICLVLSSLLILDSMNFASALVYLIIAGRIPGTDLYIDASSTILVFITICGFFAGRLTMKVLARVAQSQLNEQNA